MNNPCCKTRPRAAIYSAETDTAPLMDPRIEQSGPAVGSCRGREGVTVVRLCPDFWWARVLLESSRKTSIEVTGEERAQSVRGLFNLIISSSSEFAGRKDICVHRSQDSRCSDFWGFSDSEIISSGPRLYCSLRERVLGSPECTRLPQAGGQGKSLQNLLGWSLATGRGQKRMRITPQPCVTADGEGNPASPVRSKKLRSCVKSPNCPVLI